MKQIKLSIVLVFIGCLFAKAESVMLRGANDTTLSDYEDTGTIDDTRNEYEPSQNETISLGAWNDPDAPVELIGASILPNQS